MKIALTVEFIVCLKPVAMHPFTRATMQAPTCLLFFPVNRHGKIHTTRFAGGR